jgi:sugar lactone lactonase YvrE
MIQTVATGFTFLEGPRWHQDRLWCSDFYSGRVLAIDLDGNVEAVASLVGQPSGLGWLPGGELLVVSMLDRRVLRLDGEELVEHADLTGIATGHCNDMLVDGAGRAWVGNFGFDLVGGAAPVDAALARVDPDGSVSVAATGLRFPNGMALIDGDTLVVAESMGMLLTAFTVGPGGELTDRRTWAELDTMFPDGICADASGAIWIADAAGHRCVRIAEGGEVLETVEAGTGTFACALGGPQGDTLFICAAPSFLPGDLVGNQATLLAVRVEVPAP